MPAGERDLPGSFVAWVDARHGALLRTAYLLTGDGHTAQDLVQTALAKLYLAWPRLRDQDRLDGYARRMLVNELRSSWRRAARRPKLLTADPPETGVAADEYDDLRDVVWDALATLPPRQRAVLVLRYYEDLSEAQTAEALGISVGGVKSQASRGLARLRGRLDRHPELGLAVPRRTDDPG